MAKNLFDQPVTNDIKIYNITQKIATCHGDDYKTCASLDYPYFQENYKLTEKDLTKRQALDADPKAVQQINLTGNFERTGNTTLFFILEEVKETIVDFSRETVKVLYTRSMNFIWY